MQVAQLVQMQAFNHSINNNRDTLMNTGKIRKNVYILVMVATLAVAFTPKLSTSAGAVLMADGIGAGLVTGG